MGLPETSGRRDVVVIGGSGGSFGVLRTLLGELPAGFPATLLVAVHLHKGGSLSNILGTQWSLKVSDAVSGERLSLGRVYLAVADAHLLVHDHHVLVRRGPHENRSRPAVDPLFRSAACTFGSRVIGVLLSGALNDGTAGLDAIQRCGGTILVQDPRDAEVPGMPESALKTLAVDHTFAGADLAGLLGRLIEEPPGPSPPVPEELRLEVAIAAQEGSDMGIEDRLGRQAPFTCPECDGALWEINDPRTLRYRCHIGHAITGEVMLDSKGRMVEETMERLLRIHEEQAALARKLAELAHARGREAVREELAERARLYEEDASIVRRLLARGDPA